MRLKRSNDIELDKAPRDVDDDSVARIIRLLNREDDYEQILDEIVNRYAMAIVKVVDEDSGTETEKILKVQAATETAIRNGFYEVLPLRWLPRVCHESATLYTEPGLSFEYAIDDQPHEATKRIITLAREDGGDENVMPMVDLNAFGVGTCGCYMAFESNHIRYQAVPLNAIFVTFADKIFEVDSTAEKPRTTNKTRLEECTVLVIRMGTLPNGKGQFFAWYGACEKWPNGRHVRFEADSWRKIPHPGRGGMDYVKAGTFEEKPVETELANPLTLWTQGFGGDDSPEYPLALFYEDSLHQQHKLLRCTGISRMKTNLEFDTGASRILMSVLKSARGIIALKNDSNQPLPRGWDEGMVQLFRDQLLEIYNVPAVNSDIAFNIVARSMRLAAESEGVAGYLVDSDQAQEVSGVSLKVQNHPMIRRRLERIRANKPGQRSKFNIERALINSVAGKRNGPIPLEVRETWHPGDRSFPEDPTEVVDNGLKLYEKKIWDNIEVIKRVHGFPTRDDAKAFIIQMDKDKKDNPALFGGQQEKPSLAARLKERQNGLRQQQQQTQGAENASEEKDQQGSDNEVRA